MKKIKSLICLALCIVTFTGCTNGSTKTAVNNIVVSNEAVLKAEKDNDLSTMKKLLDKGANVDIVDEKSNTPLINALENNEFELAKLLIPKTKDINKKDTQGQNALYHAVHEGYINKSSVVDIAKMITAKGGEVNNFDTDNKKSTLDYAIMSGDLELVKVLVEAGADINYADTKGETPLWFAADTKQIAEYLTSKGASLDKSKQSYKSANSVYVLKPDLQLTETHCEDGYICGTVVNNTSQVYGYVEADINLYDDAGNQVGNTLANVNTLEANGQWKFKAPVIEKNVKTFKVTRVWGN